MIEVVIISVLVVIFVIGVFVAMIVRERKDLIKGKGKYPEGHFVALGLIFGACVGLPVGILLRNIAFGSSIGLAAGLLLGALVDDKYKRDGRVRVLTRGERNKEGGILKLIFIVVLSILVIVSAVAVVLGVS